MKKIESIIKGTAIGVANVIAGLSGSTIAVLCKVYNQILDFCSNVIFHPIKLIKKNFFLILGILIGLLGGVIAIEKLYKNAPLPLCLFFVGLILTSNKALYRTIKDKERKKRYYFIFIIMFIITICLPFLSGSDDANLNLSVRNALILVILGFASASSMIIPGISGSVILASVGYYEPILTMLTDTLKALLKGDFSLLKDNLVLIFAFVLGAILGVVLIAKLIIKLLKCFKMGTMSGILGLVFASPIAIMIVVFKNNNMFNSRMDILMWAIGLITLGIGLFIGELINKYDLTHQEYDYLEEAKKYKEELVKDTIDLLKIDTVLKTKYNKNSLEPFGNNMAEAFKYFENLAKRDGFKYANVDNHAIHIEYGEGDEILGILGHLDVVPCNDLWDSDPFSPTIKNEAIYARGALDDKGPVMASYYAMKMLKDLGMPINKRIRLILGCDEETESRCLKHYFTKKEKPNIGFSPDAEFPLIYGEKAFHDFKIVIPLDNSLIINYESGNRTNIVPDKAVATLESDYKNEYLEYLKVNNYKGEVIGNKYYAYGKSNHAMEPNKGINANFILIRFLNSINPNNFTELFEKYFNFDYDGTKLGININSQDMGCVSINPGIFKFENNKITVFFDLRVPCDNYHDTVFKALENISKEFNCQFEFTREVPIHYVSKDSKLVSTLMESYQDITHDYRSQPYTIGGGTYAKLLDNCVAFGPLYPKAPDVIHKENEYIKIEDLMKDMAIYAKAIYGLTK